MGALRAALGEAKAKGTFFFGGYALYLAFSYITFHSFTIFASVGALGPSSQTLFLAIVLASRFAVFVFVAVYSLRSPACVVRCRVLRVSHVRHGAAVFRRG